MYTLSDRIDTLKNEVTAILAQDSLSQGDIRRLGSLDQQIARLYAQDC